MAHMAVLELSGALVTVQMHIDCAQEPAEEAEPVNILRWPLRKGVQGNIEC